jgi:predicted  nucleic acid-binding Zn-ribbon protein
MIDEQKPDLFNICTSMGKLEGLMIAINQRIDSFQKDVSLIRDELNKKDACWHESFDSIRTSKEEIHRAIDTRIDEINKKIDDNEKNFVIERTKIYTVVSTVMIGGGLLWTIVSFVIDHFLK